MQQVQIVVPFQIQQAMSGVRCECGFAGIILAAIQVETNGETVPQIVPVGGTAFCPKCGKKSPVESREPYLNFDTE